MASEVDWSFDGRWPYEARFFDSPDGRLAYVDEGRTDAEPVVLLHGNPTWGYLYRRVIPPLVADGRRAIAVDHLGFGRSEKSDRAELYRVPAHAARLEALLESLELQSATLVVHDWSGPIGLRWAVRHPERVAACSSSTRSRLACPGLWAHARPHGRSALPGSARSSPDGGMS